MCLEEFRLRNFRLTYPNGKDFAVSPVSDLLLVILAIGVKKLPEKLWQNLFGFWRNKAPLQVKLPQNLNLLNSVCELQGKHGFAVRYFHVFLLSFRQGIMLSTEGNYCPLYLSAIISLLTVNELS